MKDNVIKFPGGTVRKTIEINGKQYNTRYLDRKSMLPHADVEYIGYYDFDLEEHGALYGFLFVKKVNDNANKMIHYNVLIDQIGKIVATNASINSLKAIALAHIGASRG
ncbi:MAG: hypothetical protein FWH33_06790 [Oscillospiraceae bacterium]|nr:hypothetical protein [Oscillospiraceae bacterium]